MPGPRTLRLPALLLLLLAVAARAQSPLEPEVDLNLLALNWTRGEWRSPLVCTIEGTAHRGLRRLLIDPGPRHARPPSFRLRLFDLEVPDGTRCTDENGRPQPNAEGALYFYLKAISRTDTAKHDFETTLRREGRFEFHIRQGRLRLTEEAGGSSRQVDFAGGQAEFAVVKRGSDAYRRLAAFGDRRRLTLRLEARDGTRLDLDLAQWGMR